MSEDRLTKVQKEVDEVKNIMGENIDKVIDRGEKLENLEERSTQLNENSYQFKKGATKLKRNMCMQNLKLTLIIAMIVIIIILIIVLAAVYS
ncbi:vamp (vesicle associated membrane protein) [Anaeramoeba flamelloides]|uniref:Vamp (Vesicle associated membrane protein) n=1 Tax=Anaeramoeba flamelloides TaxID=1746091 RepID=A0AAV7YNV4_9EUKA|nr:vamp (vesicle associated membrane protein) [Anaeramoeba flamelloides]